MARARRIEYKGAWYHVMNRGAGRRKIYHTKKDYEIFLELLREITNRYQIDIHAYCLMPNHKYLASLLLIRDNQLLIFPVLHTPRYK